MDKAHSSRNKNKRPLRPLLPANGEAPKVDPAPPTPKRSRVSNACSACRTRKTKCSGERPKCSKCILYSTTCEYPDTERQLLHERYNNFRSQQTAYAELFNQLVTLPENESLNMLRRIRASHDPSRSPIRPPYPHPDHGASSEAGVGKAHHDQLKRKAEQLDQMSDNITNVYGLLQHASEHGANELFRHIRQGMSPKNVPAFTGELLTRRSPSPNQINRNILPPDSTATGLEYELTILHNLPYPVLEPVELPKIGLDHLAKSN
ncbi:unnamed protein product [Periconia digitata]|uniref:Zn(2)-C6 fungal-type domain-containing protein n=1 Tax=Periconia digitata TaxID=1303443 RepID=A0A9W4UTB7_9PLEO|nr:unnamed protein product [Periconia digitata]